MLVAIQFPGHFVIADDVEIQKWNLEPWLERRALVVDAIEMPVDVGTVVEILETEQAKTMLADFVCLTDDGGGFVRKVLPKQIGAGRSLARREKELCPCEFGVEADVTGNVTRGDASTGMRIAPCLPPKR